MENLEMETTEPVLDDLQPADPVPEDTAPEEESGSTGDTLPADETDNTGTDESTGSDPEAPEEETGSEEASEDSGSGEDAGDRNEEPGTEEPSEDDETEELPEAVSDQADDTVSGNDIVTISGNAVIFPEDFDLSLLGSSEGGTVDLTALTEAVEYQNRLIYTASLVIILFLGVIAGILLVHGFRLMRT